MNNEANPTKEQIRSSITIIRAVADAIKEAGAVPSGTLYSMLMGYGMTLPTYNKMIDILKESGRVKEVNHLLYWIPEAPMQNVKEWWDKISLVEQQKLIEKHFPLTMHYAENLDYPLIETIYLGEQVFVPNSTDLNKVAGPYVPVSSERNVDCKD